MGNITGALIENAFQPQNESKPPLDVQEEIKKIARQSSNRELYRLLHARMEQSAFDRATPSRTATLNSEGDFDGAAKKWESTRRPSAEEQSSVRCSSASSGGGRSGGPQCVENAPLSSESGGRSVDGKSGGLSSSKPAGDQDGAREVPQISFKKKLLKSYCTENEDSTAKTDSSIVSPQGEKDGGKKDEVVGPEMNVKDPLKAGECRTSSDLKNELFSDSDIKSRTKLMNINTCIEVIVMNELKKLDSDDMPSGKQMPLFATLESTKNRSCESRANDLGRMNASNSRSSVETAWLLRNESSSRAVDSGSKREKLQQYVNVDAPPGRAPSEFSPQQLPSRKSDIGTQGGSVRNVPLSAYRGSGYPPEASLGGQDVPRMYTLSSSESTARNPRLTNNQFGESGVEVPMSHGPVVKYSPSTAWSRDISPAQSSPHVMMTGDSGFKVMSSGQQLPSMSMLDPRRKPEREPEPTKYQQQAEYLPYGGQQQYHGISSLSEQHSAYQNCPPALQEKLHASEAAPYGYPAKNSRDRVHGGQFDSSYGNHPDCLQPPVANYTKHSPKNSPILTYERDSARPPGPESQYHRSDQPQYHRSDQQQQYHRFDQPQYHRPDFLKSQPGSLMTGSARSYRMVADQQPPQPQVCYRNDGTRQARGELLQMDKKGFPYQSTPEEYVERRMKRTNSNSRETGNASVGMDQPGPRTLSVSYPPRGGREGTEKVQSGHTEETPLDLTVKKEFSDAHHPSMYLLPSGVKQQQTDWAVERGIGYRPSYAGEEDLLNSRLMNRPPVQKGPDFAVPEMQRRDMLDVRNLYDKVPSGLQVLPPEAEVGRMVPTSVNERSMGLRTSVIASHPFEDSPASLAPNLHLTMHHISEALTKSSMHPMGAWKQSPYMEMVPRSRAHTLESEPSSRLTVDANSRQERPRPRPNNSSGTNDMLHLATTSPTIPHLSPVQPLVSTAGSQAPGSRRAPGPSILGSHSPSDILHLQCKVCLLTYGSLRSFRMHFAKVHGLEPLPEHCNISTISGTKNAMSKVPTEDSEPPALQRETMPTDVASMGKNRSGFDSFAGATARPMKPDVLRVEPTLTNTRTKQVAEVYPMPARVSRGLSPQLKADAQAASAWRPELTDSHAEQNDSQTKLGGDAKNSGRLVNCDLGIFRSRNCYSDLGCDRDTDCPECLDGFKDISDWKMHISTHMMRSCTCKVCNVSFTHSGALKKHLHGVHSHVEKVEVEYRCLFCREAFSDEKVLFYHTQEHEKRYSRLDGSRRDSASSLSFKAPGGGTVDSSDCQIQMAVPDTTCTDDVRPTSDFGGENSSNVSPSSIPGAESKGNRCYESKLAGDQVNVDGETVGGRKTEAFGIDDDKKTKTEEVELSHKHRTLLRGLDSSAENCRSSEQQSRLDAASQLLYRGHGVKHELKMEDREMSTEVKPEPKFSFEIGEECRHFKPTVTPKAVEEASTFVWKKQAILKRVQSVESRDLIETDSNAPRDKLSPAASLSRSSAGAGAEKSPGEVSQPPMHLRDLFSMMSHQVEKSIWGIPDFPQFNPVPSTKGSRCVRDVCDEIIALSFREESSPREPVPGSSVQDKSDINTKTKITEQLKNLVNLDNETRPEPPDVRTNTEGLYGGWTRSPCSSQDSCHSLEIDESGFNRDSAEGDSARLESTDSEPRSLYGEPVVGSTSPRQEYGRKDSTEVAPEDGKYPGEGDAKVPFGSRSSRGRSDEGVSRHSEAFYVRRQSSEGPQSDAAAVTSRTKDAGLPSSSKQETSAEGDNGNSYTPTPMISSESVPTTVGSKRKLPTDGVKETTDADEEPPAKKSAPC